MKDRNVGSMDYLGDRAGLRWSAALERGGDRRETRALP